MICEKCLNYFGLTVEECFTRETPEAYAMRLCQKGIHAEDAVKALQEKVSEMKVRDFLAVNFFDSDGCASTSGVIIIDFFDEYVDILEFNNSERNKRKGGESLVFSTISKNALAEYFISLDVQSLEKATLNDVRNVLRNECQMRIQQELKNVMDEGLDLFTSNDFGSFDEETLDCYKQAVLESQKIMNCL